MGNRFIREPLSLSRPHHLEREEHTAAEGSVSWRNVRCLGGNVSALPVVLRLRERCARDTIKLLLKNSARMSQMLAKRLI